jgi:hypothetical protein
MSYHLKLKKKKRWITQNELNVHKIKENTQFTVQKLQLHPSPTKNSKPQLLCTVEW